MPLMNAFSKAVVRDFSLEELEEAARLMRGYALVTLCAAGAGDAGGALSIMDIVAVLYLKVAVHDPNTPEWPHRDRIVWPAGHKTLALHLGLAFAGYFPIEDVVTLRKLYAPTRSRPHRPTPPGVEVSSGSQGQGLSVGVDMALAGKLDHDEHTVFCIMDGGEQQESSVWESAMEAAHDNLDNLVAIVDRNRMQIDGRPEDAADTESLRERYRGLGWEVIEIDGHEMRQVIAALQKAKNAPVLGKPTVIIAHTVIGKGVTTIESAAGRHGQAPSYDEMVEALDELGLKGRIAYDALLAFAKAEHEDRVAVRRAEPRLTVVRR